MPEYVHPDVSRAGDDDESLVELLVIPTEGKGDYVKEAIESRSGAYEEDVFGVLEVEISAAAGAELAELDAIQSIAPADIGMRNLNQGN